MPQNESKLPSQPAQSPNPDDHKGAIEGDRPNDQQHSNPLGEGIDDQGMPNDPVATAQDRIGATVDESEGG